MYHRAFQGLEGVQLTHFGVKGNVEADRLDKIFQTCRLVSNKFTLEIEDTSIMIEKSKVVHAIRINAWFRPKPGFSLRVVLWGQI